MKGTINQEKIISLNIYAQNSDAHNFINSGIKAQINTNPIIASDLNAPLSPIGKSSTQKANRNIKIN